jgi:hypothetical protein
MQTTRPTDDDLRVIVQTLAISGSIGQDDGSALLREIDAMRADLEAARRDLETVRSKFYREVTRRATAERDRERLRVALESIVDQAEYAPEDAPDIARDALAAEHRSEAGEGADA